MLLASQRHRLSVQPVGVLHIECALTRRRRKPWCEGVIWRFRPAAGRGIRVRSTSARTLGGRGNRSTRPGAKMDVQPRLHTDHHNDFGTHSLRAPAIQSSRFISDKDPLSFILRAYVEISLNRPRRKLAVYENLNQAAFVALPSVFANDRPNAAASLMDWYT